ncbi:MAG: hypothetical protein H6924_03745 [Alphaproteobacteria bacterium]|nr:hypothetical protein [Alphaproteobacteria bacterium]
MLLVLLPPVALPPLPLAVAVPPAELPPVSVLSPVLLELSAELSTVRFSVGVEPLPLPPPEPLPRPTT